MHAAIPSDEPLDNDTIMDRAIDQFAAFMPESEASMGQLSSVVEFGPDSGPFNEPVYISNTAHLERLGRLEDLNGENRPATT